MTVKELIKKLQKLPPNTRVWCEQQQDYDNATDVCLEWFSTEVSFEGDVCKKTYDGKLTKEQLLKKIGNVDQHIIDSFEHIATIWC